VPRVILILIVALLGGGCASVATLPISSLLPAASSSVDIRSQTSVKLDEANFIVIKTNVVGQCKGFALLGFIGISPAQFTTAMDQLYAKAEMQTGKPQSLANVIVERSSKYLILFSIPKVSVRADVVEFVTKQTDQPRLQAPP